MRYLIALAALVAIIWLIVDASTNPRQDWRKERVEDCRALCTRVGLTMGGYDWGLKGGCQCKVP